MNHPVPSLADQGPRRAAAAGALAFVASFVVAILLAGTPVVHEGQDGVEHSWSERGLTAVLGSMFVHTLGFVALVVTLAYLATALGRRSAAGSLASRVAWVGGLGYVFIIAMAFAAGAAAAWAHHQGDDLTTVLAVNNVRNFAYFAVMPFMGLASLGFGIAALTDRVMTTWVGWGGVVVGVLCFLAAPAAAIGVAYAMPLWLLWWLGVGVTLLRAPLPVEGSPIAQEAPRSGTMTAR